MKHAIITRFDFPTNDPTITNRLKIFQEQLLNSLNNQTNQNFELWVRCNKEHEHLIKELNPRIQTFQYKKIGEPHPKYAKRPALEPFDTQGFENYDVLTRLDTDDSVREDFVARIQEEYNKSSGVPTILSFLPYRKDLKTGELYRSKKNPYSNTKTTAFLSFLNPTQFIYKDSHLRMWKYADETITIPEGYAFIGIHQNNSTTRINLNKHEKLNQNS